MTGAVLIPLFVTVEDAIDYVEKFGEVVSVSLQRGEDGMVRGNAIVLIPVEYTAPGYNATIKLE